MPLIIDTGAVLLIIASFVCLCWFCGISARVNNRVTDSDREGSPARAEVRSVYDDNTDNEIIETIARKLNTTDELSPSIIVTSSEARRVYMQ